MAAASLLDPSFFFHLAAASQRFACAVTALQPDAFVTAVRQLTAEIPACNSGLQIALAWPWLSGVALRGATSHDQLFHRCFGGKCAHTGPWLPPPEGFSTSTVSRVLRLWADDWTASFQREHCWPAAVKAAALLRRHPRERCYMCDIARETGVSLPTLERGFRAIYGTTPQHYHAIVRTRYAAVAIRRDRGSLEGVLLDTGWHSVEDAYRSFRAIASQTPCAIRAMSDDEFAALLVGRLGVPDPGITC